MLTFCVFAIAVQLWTGWNLKDLIDWIKDILGKSKDVAAAATKEAKKAKK